MQCKKKKSVILQQEFISRWLRTRKRWLLMKCVVWRCSAEQMYSPLASSVYSQGWRPAQRWVRDFLDLNHFIRLDFRLDLFLEHRLLHTRNKLSEEHIKKPSSTEGCGITFLQDKTVYINNKEIQILGSVSNDYGSESRSKVILTLWILFSLLNVLQCFFI